MICNFAEVPSATGLGRSIFHGAPSCPVWLVGDAPISIGLVFGVSVLGAPVQVRCPAQRLTMGAVKKCQTSSAQQDAHLLDMVAQVVMGQALPVGDIDHVGNRQLLKGPR